LDRDDAGWHIVDLPCPNGALTSDYNEYQLVMNPYNASGEPVPVGGTKGNLWFMNGVPIYSSLLDRAATTIKFSAAHNSASSAIEVDRLQTKSDLAKLKTPWRGLFNDTFDFLTVTPVLKPPPFPTDPWVDNGDGTASIDGSQSVLTNLDFLHDGITSGDLVRVVYEVLTVNAGACISIFGGVPGISRTAPGVYEEIYDATATIAYGAIQADTDFDGTVRYDTLIVEKVDDRGVENYLPEDGPKLVADLGGMSIANNRAQPTIDTAVISVYNNPGGGYWEISELAQWNHYAGIIFRYQDSSNYWVARTKSVDATAAPTMYITEVVAGVPTNRATLAMTAGVGILRFILSDDGNNIKFISPADGKVATHASTAGAGNEVAGIYMEGGSSGNARIYWHGARMGTVAPYV